MQPWLRCCAPRRTLLFASAAPAQSLVAVPPLTSPVTDITGTLAADQVAALDAKLRAFEQAKGSQVAVVIVRSTQPETIEQYALRVVEAWKIGRKGVDDGAILVVALDDRKLRIEVGYGLEGALPDASANRIIDEDIVPAFRRGDFYGGIATGVDRMLRVIEGEPLPEPELRSPSQGVPGLFSVLPFLFIFALFGGSIFRRLFGRVGGAFATGGLVGFLTWVLVGILGLALGAAILAFLFALLGGLGGGGGGGRPPAATAGTAGATGAAGGIPAASVAVGSAAVAASAVAGAAAAAVSVAAAPREGGESMDWGRWLRHLFATRTALRRAFPVDALDAIEQAITASERHHSGEIRFAIEGSLEPGDAWRGKPPRARALEVFAALGVWDTAANNGVLVYVLLADRDGGDRRRSRLQRLRDGCRVAHGL